MSMDELQIGMGTPMPAETKPEASFENVMAKQLKGDAILLKPSDAKTCPFCGCLPEIQPWHGGGPQKRLISCSNDACVVSPSVTGTTKKRALQNWNWRLDARS